MRLCFGNIIDLYADNSAITGLLMFCLASLVHHSDKIEEIVSVRPGHSLGTIPIMNDASLLAELKKLVTLEPAGEVSVHVQDLRHNLGWHGSRRFGTFGVGGR